MKPAIETENKTQSTQPQIPPHEIVLTPDLALTVLINAARIGQEKGIYSLEEAEMIAKSIRLFVTTPGPAPSSAH